MKAFATALLVFGLLTAVVHRGLVAHAGDAIYVPPPADPAAGPPIGDFARGDQLLHVWALATNLRHLYGDGGLFEANSYWPMPHPLFFSDHLFGEALAVWPLSALTDAPLLLHNLALLASFVLCGAGTALLVRSLGGSLLAGLVAGVAWAFSPARGFEIFQLQLLTTQWIPFLVLAIHRTFARPGWRPALAVALLLALQLLSGIYVGAYLVLALAAFVPLLALAAAPAPRRSLVLLAVGGTLALAANAPWLATYLEVRAALGEYGGLLENVAYALSLQHYLLPTWAIGGGRFPGPLGVTLGTLALVGALAPRGGRVRLAYAATTVWTIALSLGPYVRWGASPDTAGGPGFLGPGPYAALLALVPGLEALRVPARMSLVAGFFVAVLAGLGADAVLRRLRAPGARGALAFALGALLFTEARFATPALETLPPAPLVYTWLREHGAGEPMVELPMNVLRDPLYLVRSTAHRRPLANGYGAYLPTPYLHLQQLLQHFPAPATVAALRSIDIRHVVTHGLAPLTGDGVGAAATFGDDRVYAVEPGPLPEPAATPGLRRLPHDGWRGRGGADTADSPAAYDGDPRTAWSNVGDLTADLGWLAGIDGWSAWESAYALRGRPQRYTLDLGRDVTPARVEILLRVHQSPVFAPFTLETSADGSTWAPVPCPWRPAADLRTFAARPADTALAVTCAYPTFRHLRIVQTPATFRLYWEIADVQVLVPAGSGPLPGDGGP